MGSDRVGRGGLGGACFGAGDHRSDGCGYADAHACADCDANSYACAAADGNTPSHGCANGGTGVCDSGNYARAYGDAQRRTDADSIAHTQPDASSHDSSHSHAARDGYGQGDRAFD